MASSMTDDRIWRLTIEVRTRDGGTVGADIPVDDVDNADDLLAAIARMATDIADELENRDLLPTTPKHPVPRAQRRGTNCEEFEEYGCPVDVCPAGCYLASPEPWDIEQVSAAFLARLERQPPDRQRAAIHQLSRDLER